MANDNKKAPTPKERLTETLRDKNKNPKPRLQDFKSEDWYDAAFARFSVSWASRGDTLNRLLPPKKF